MTRYPNLGRLPAEAVARLTCYQCRGTGERATARLACDVCRGTGLACPTCGGRRWVRPEPAALGTIAPCPQCPTPEAWQATIAAYIQAAAA